MMGSNLMELIVNYCELLTQLQLNSSAKLQIFGQRISHKLSAEEIFITTNLTHIRFS